MSDKIPLPNRRVAPASGFSNQNASSHPAGRPNVRSQAHRRNLRLPRNVNAVFLGIALIGGVHAAVMIGLETQRLVQHRQLMERMNVELEQLTLEYQELLETTSKEKDAAFREQLARNIGYVYPDETIVTTLNRHDTAETAETAE